VYGLYAGLKRTFLIPILLKNTRMNPRNNVIRGRKQRRPREIASQTYEIGEGEPPVRNDALDVVELRQMGRVHGFVAEHTVDAE
jgi:hypothetical protein